MKALADWLAPVADLPLECDGLTRVISMLMQREGLAHRVCIGALAIPGVGRIPYHWWIVMPDGQTCDFRARMWLGNAPQVPHGLCSPALHIYTAESEVEPVSIALPPAIFTILAGKSMDSFPAFEHANVCKGMKNERPR